MKFLALFALLAVAAARPEYHDDVFHFSSLSGLESLRKSSGSLSGSLSSGSLQANRGSRQQILITKQVSQPAVTQYTVSQPAQITIQKQLSAPAITQQYTVSQPAQFTIQKQLSAPAVTQQYTIQKQLVQPAVQQYTTVSQPAVQQYTTVSQPSYSQVQTQSIRSQSSSAEGGARILAQTHEVDPLGYYRVSFQTENGITHQEQQTLTSAGSADESIAKEGSYTYTGPDGVQYTVTYTADENGFTAAGEHLPTPPPIPAEILRALEINEAEGGQYDEQGFPVRK